MNDRRMSSSVQPLRYFRAFRTYVGKRLYIVFVLTVLAAMAEGFGIALLLPLLEATEAGGSEAIDGGLQQYLYDMLHFIGIGDSVVGILLFIGGVFVLKGFLKFVEGAYNGYLESRLMRELKSKMFQAYSLMDYRYYIKNNTGHFINIINSQVDGFYRAFKRSIKFISVIITTASYFIIAFFIAWRFALMAVGIGLVLLFLFKYLNAYVRNLSRRASKERGTLNKLLVQALQAFKYIASTGQMAHLRDGVVESIRRYTGYRFRQKLAGSFTGALKEPISVLFMILVIVIQVAVFNDPIAPIFVALILFHRGMQSMISIQGGWQSVMDQIGSLEMVTDEFDHVHRYREKGGDTAVNDLATGIELDNVTFAYDPDEAPALQEVNLTIPVNTTIAFVGESGAGKSTLVDLLTLMLKPSEGEVRIDGTPGADVKLPTWRQQIGYVSQETVVFDDTIANNISLWKNDSAEARARIEDAARRAYAHDFIEGLPDGYDTVVGDRGVRLSGGQRQRLFIARELFKQPNLLILDEATSALDTESERFIQESIDALKGEMTVVIIAHRLSTIKNVDYVYVLDEGRVVEEGPYEDLRRDNGRFQRMVEMQSL
jgi:subfamily B ATP-binding cassette protein MsbA